MVAVGVEHIAEQTSDVVIEAETVDRQECGVEHRRATTVPPDLVEDLAQVGSVGVAWTRQVVRTTVQLTRTSGCPVSADPRACRGGSLRPVGTLVARMVDRELEALATARQEDDGLRLRVLMRMVDRVRELT